MRDSISPALVYTQDVWIYDLAPFGSARKEGNDLLRDCRTDTVGTRPRKSARSIENDFEWRQSVVACRYSPLYDRSVISVDDQPKVRLRNA